MSAPSPPRGDPAWIATAERIYSALLWLFPPSHRREFGALMQQAFRDRCREIARGETSAWRSFALELVPDLLGNLGWENMQMTFGVMRMRTALLLGLLIISSAFFLFGQPLGAQAADGVARGHKQVKALLKHFFYYQPRNKDHNRRLYLVAEPLAAEPGSQSKAAAVVLYRSTRLVQRLEPGALSPDIQAAQALTAQVLAGKPDELTLQLLARACGKWNGCDLADISRRLRERSPGNGLGWYLEYSIADAYQARDVPRMRRALANLARAEYFDAHEGQVAAILLGSGARFAPDDEETMIAVASARNVFGAIRQPNLALFCDQARVWQWSKDVPEEEFASAREDCVDAGRVMAKSTQLMVAMQGLKMVSERSLDPAEQEAALGRRRELEQLMERMRPADRQRGSLSHFHEMWIASHRRGLGEIASVRWWLARRDGQDSSPRD